jgi:4'-phosphopantetheinyl transferase
MGTDVGIDVEGVKHSPTQRRIATRYFSEAENRQLDACMPSEYAARFIEVWTLKESFIKAIGTGLNHLLNSFSVAFDASGGIHFDSSESTGPAWQFALAAPSPRYRLGVAVRCEAPGRRYRITLQDDESGAITEPPLETGNCRSQWVGGNASSAGVPCAVR